MLERKDNVHEFILLLGSVALIVMFVASATSGLAWDEFLVLTTDFTTLGSVCAVERYDPWSAECDLEYTCSDAVGRYHEGLYYIVGRGGCDHIQILDPGNGYQTVRQFRLGQGLNPQDIAFGSDGTAYVSCYDSALLLEVDVEAGTVLDSFSTAEFADPDGLPETAWMLAVDDLLFITCQLLDRDNWYLPSGPGQLLVFDMNTDGWVDVVPGTAEVDGIALAGANPYTQIELSLDRTQLRVGCNGVYGLLDGGVEVVDLTSRTSLGFEVTEATLGGDIIDYTNVSSSMAYTIVSDVSFQTSVVSYNPLTGGEVEVVDAANTYVHVDLAHDGVNLLYIADRTLGNAGLRVFDVTTGVELTAEPIATGMPPAMIVLPLEESLTSVPLGVRSDIHLAAPWPNPANPGTTIRFQGPTTVPVPLRLYDLRGRLIRAAVVTTDGEGHGEYFFDGRDGAGRNVASGSYRIVVGEGAETVSRGVTLVR